MFPGIAILTFCLSALLASATPFKERSGAPINGMTLSVDSGKLCEGHQVNISWGDTSLGAVSCICPESFILTWLPVAISSSNWYWRILHRGQLDQLVR